MDKAKITVLRAFCLAGERQEVGATVEVPEALARELVALGKAERTVEAARPRKSKSSD